MNNPHITRPLSPREVQVVACLAQGNQIQAVGNLLGISPKTASTHLYRAVRKLGIHNRADLTCAAIRLGYILCPCPAHAVKSEVMS